MSLSFAEGLFAIAQNARSIETQKTGASYRISEEKDELDAIARKIMTPIAAPIIKLARFAVFLEDGSPTTVSLERVGKDGAIFLQKKIRSMEKGTELGERNGVNRRLIKVTGDDAVTRVGRIIRRASIDELTQFENIAAGEMSLVGSRPIPIDQFNDYCRVDESFRAAYCSGLPGLTGLAQVRGRANLSDEETVKFAIQYGEEACLALDLHIIRCTALSVLRGEGAY